MKSLVAIAVLIFLVLMGILINLKSLAPVLEPPMEKVVDEAGQSPNSTSTTEILGETSTNTATSTTTE